MNKRVLLAGLYHETHTFLEGQIGLPEFTVRRGDELRDACGDGSPMCGVWEVALDCQWDVLPVIDMRTKPGPIVADEVFDAFWDAFEATAQREIPQGIDGIYLVLHGAMVTRTHDDPEGDIIERIRQIPGAENVPICGVLDLHGNSSRKMAELSQGLVVYRCNPHTDSRQSAIDGARLLDRIMTTGRFPRCLWHQPPVMWPPTGTGTDDDPMRSLEAQAREIERQDPEIVAVNIFGGYSFADTPDTGVSMTAITYGPVETAQAHLQKLGDWAIEHRQQGNVVDRSLEEVMPLVLQHIAKGQTPVVLVEPSDNIGGGAPGDGTSILRCLLAQGIQNAAVAINDPAAVERLSGLQPGETLPLSLGGKGSRLAEGPLELAVELVSTSDGRFDLEDRHSHLASMNGIHIEMGPCAVVRADGVSILLTSHKTPPFDLGQFRSQGIIPEEQTVIGVKAAVAHRQAYNPIQKASYTVATPGPCASDLSTLPFEKVRRPIFPLDEI